MTGKGRFLAAGISIILIAGLLLSISFISHEAATGAIEGDQGGADPAMGAGGDSYENASSDGGIDVRGLAGSIPWQTGLIAFLAISFACLIAFYARLSPDEVLDGLRKDIFLHVESNPGDHLAGITRALNISTGSARHHLDVLEWSELIVSHKADKMKHYYPNRNGYRVYAGHAGYKEVLAALRNPMAREMVKHLMANGNANQTDIALALGLHPSTVNWHSGRLVSAGIVSKSREGKDVRFSLNLDIDLEKAIALVEGHIPGSEPPQAIGEASS